MINTAVNRRYEKAECFIASITAAIGQVAIIQPALGVQTHMQINGSSLSVSTKTLTKQHMLYRGFTSTFATRSIMYGAKFPVLPAFKDAEGNVSWPRMLGATATMVGTESLAAAPLDSIRVQTGLLNAPFTTLSGGIRYTAHEVLANNYKPLQRLYTGLGSHTLMNATSAFLMFPGYKAFDDYATVHEWSSQEKDLGRFAVGGLAGAASVLGAPFEQMRNRKIAKSLENQTISYRDVLQNEGLGSLFRGWVPKLAVKTGGTAVLTLIFPYCLDGVQYGVDFATHSSSTHRKHPKYMHPLIEPMHIFVDAYREEASLESLRSTTQTRQETTILSKRGFFAERFMERFADFLIHNCSTESLSAGTSLSDRKY